MDQSPLDDPIREQYERWNYPEPIMDLDEWLRWSWQWYDPSHAHRVLWPGREYQECLDILVAGCGTNQAAVIAYTNPGANVVGVDISEHSLDHHRYLARTYGLANLELHQLPIEDITELGRDFDLIISTGVLHHLADPVAGLRALAQCLRPEAVLALMVYASYGRLGVEIMQSIFTDLRLGRDVQSLALIRDAMGQVNPQHPLVGYLQVAPDLASDAGLVDTFVNARERSYTIDECQEFVHAAGLVFQDLFLKAPYYASRANGSGFLSRLSTLTRELQWSVMERMNTQNACHFFMACRPDRPARSYAIDFSGDRALQYVPSFRYRCDLQGDLLSKPGGQVPLEPWERELVSLVDGERGIAAIIDLLHPSADGPHERTAAAIAVFERLWQQDYLAMGIPGGP